MQWKSPNFRVPLREYAKRNHLQWDRTNEWGHGATSSWNLARQGTTMTIGLDGGCNNGAMKSSSGGVHANYLVHYMWLVEEWEFIWGTWTRS